MIENYPEIQTAVKNLQKEIKLINCPNIPSAIDILRNEKVNLIIINQKIEDTNIYSFLQDIRNRNSETKLFAILPNNKTYITNCIKCGLNDYIEQDEINNKCIVCRLEKSNISN